MPFIYLVIIQLITEYTNTQESIIAQLKKTFSAVKLLTEKAIDDKECYGDLSNVDKSILENIDEGIAKEKAEESQQPVRKRTNPNLYETPIVKIDMMNYRIEESELRRYFSFFFEESIPAKSICLR
jgi:hypothetical protein